MALFTDVSFRQSACSLAESCLLEFWQIIQDCSFLNDVNSDSLLLELATSVPSPFTLCVMLLNLVNVFAYRFEWQLPPSATLHAKYFRVLFSGVCVFFDP